MSTSNVITRNWRDLIRPRGIHVEAETLTEFYGKFTAEPLERGFGITVGNSLRRILLSSLQGAAITALRVEGALHEFTTIGDVVEDVTERETARRQLAVSEEYARGLFQHSPVSLWVEDFATIKRLLDELRERGISDFRVFSDVHPEFVERCMSEIRVIDVNRHTLELFCATDKQTLLQRLGEVFRDDMRQHFKEQLIDLWQGKLFQQREVVNYALDGTKLHLLLQFSVLPNHEHDWSLVQVALTDITARSSD